MVLSDGDIAKVLDRGRVKCEPPPERSDIQPCSLDLTLGHQFLLQERKWRWFGPWVERTVWVASGRPFTIAPGSFVLATTQEELGLPADLLGHVDGRSSIGRRGLFVENAGFIDPGFIGTITLELFNASRKPVVVTVGMKICQISFTALTEASLRPYGHPERRSKYQYQRGVTASRLEEI